jgi:hypothetical protein
VVVCVFEDGVLVVSLGFLCDLRRLCSWPGVSVGKLYFVVMRV